MLNALFGKSPASEGDPPGYPLASRSGQVQCVPPRTRSHLCRNTLGDVVTLASMHWPSPSDDRDVYWPPSQGKTPNVDKVDLV
jgi:hypothetical protein